MPVYSTVASASNALIYRDQMNPLTVLEQAFPNPSIRAYLQTVIGDPSFLIKPLPDSEIVIEEEFGAFSMSPAVSQRFWKFIQLIARLVVAAANGIAKPGRSFEDNFASIPKDVITFEWIRRVLPRAFGNGAFPHITFANAANRDDPLCCFISTTPDGVRAMHHSLYFLILQYCRWIERMVKVSLAKGQGSEANWGAYFGLTHMETVERLTLSTNDSMLPTLLSQKITGDLQKDFLTITDPDVAGPACGYILQPYNPLQASFDIDSPAALITKDDENLDGVFGFIKDHVRHCRFATVD
ncbi:hypothetical protein BT96DRAFT_630349 [Gymnopus androsaceus JB14]|uniref:Uncharacterized protein n=1 Tax=Gymnopus androsaceus JB14 TaxID=1447944 RepID=A0A6A4HS90_9AGAR|nr:hypothetical protein BT96DRAFT_630349 [Gymnopus androsaceus JB14]